MSELPIRRKLFIKRGQSADDIPDNPITLEEWKSVIARDDELEASESIPMRNPKTGEVFQFKTPNSAMWYYVEDICCECVCFQYMDGIIYTNDCDDDSTARKLKEMAVQLDAKFFITERKIY